MPPRKQTKKVQQERTAAVLEVEWRPVYGLFMKDFPYVFLVGKTPEEALTRLNGFKADQGAKLHHDYTVVFVNEPFEID